MKIFEKILFSAVLGALFPILGLIAVWWGIFAFFQDRVPFQVIFIGLLIGIIVDVVYLKKWVENAYSINIKIWMAIYIFYSLGMLGFFMGVPVFHLTLAIPAGFLIGGRLARRSADLDEFRRTKRITCRFTTCVLTFVCAASGTIALLDPFTGSFIQRLLGLHFEVTRWMLAVVILIGGLGLLILNWVITGKVIHRSYALMKSSISESHRTDKTS